MVNAIRRALNIEPSEGKPIGLLLAHSFFVGMFVAFYFSHANGNFINRFSLSALPYAYILSGLAGFVMSAVFSRLQSKIAYSRLITLVLLFILVLMVLFRLSWFAIGEGETSFKIFIVFGPTLTYAELVAFVVFIWIAPVLGLIALQYWGMALRLFDLRQSKRLFGIIGSGDVISSIIGFFSVPLFVRLLGGTADLLWLAAIALGVSMIFQFMLIAHFNEQLATRSGKKKKVKGDLSTILANPYFKIIFIVTILSVIAQHFVDFTYVGMVRKTFDQRAQLTSFIGVFFGVIKLVELIAKTMVVGRVLNRYGLSVGLLALAFLIGLFTFLAAISSVLASLSAGLASVAASFFFLFIAMNKLFDLSGRKAIEEPSFKVLYQPLDAETKMMVQTQAEGKAKQIGKMGAGVLLLILTSFKFFDEQIAIFILCGLVVIWFLMAKKLYTAYRHTVQEALKEDQDEPLQLTPQFSFEWITERFANRETSMQMLQHTLMVGKQLRYSLPDPKLIELITHPHQQIRFIAKDLLVDFPSDVVIQAIQHQAHKESYPELQVFWKEYLQHLHSLQQLSLDQITALTKSIRVEERLQAALWLQKYSHPNEVRLLRELIADRENRVARRALRVVVRVQNQMLYYFLTELLDNAELSPDAMEALRNLPKMLSENTLEILFREHETQPVVLTKIVQLCEQLQTPDALHFLATKIEFPNRTLQYSIVQALAQGNFMLSGTHRKRITNKLHEEAQHAAWLLTCIHETAKDSNILPLTNALKTDLQHLRNMVYQLLSILYDAQAILRIRTQLEKGTKEGVALALEMMDILLEEDTKNIVQPLLEASSYEEQYKKMVAIFPQPTLSIKPRLKNILLQDFSKISPFVKALAIQALGKISHKIPEEIKAYAFSRHPLLKETALIAIHTIQPETYASLVQQESKKTRFVFDKVTGYRTDFPQETSIMEEVEMLSSLPFFQHVSKEILMEIAIRTEEEIIAPEQMPRYAYRIGTYLHIIIEGAGNITESGKVHTLTQGKIIGLTHQPNMEQASFDITATTRILYMPLAQFFDLASVFSELTQAIFTYLSMASDKETPFNPETILQPENFMYNDW